MLDDILALFLANNEFPIGGVEGIKGFGLIYCINLWVEADKIGVGGNAVNPQFSILFLYATDDVCCYQGITWSTQSVDYGKPITLFVEGRQKRWQTRISKPSEF